MAIPLKLSTAGQVIPLGPFIDSTDGNTEKTSITVANTDIKLWKRGATTLASKNSGGATLISNGVAYCTLDATDTNTLGPMIVYVHIAGSLPLKQECEVMAANRFESDVTNIEWREVTTHAPKVARDGNDLVIYEVDDTTEQFRNVGTFTASGSADVLTALAGKT